MHFLSREFERRGQMTKQDRSMNESIDSEESLMMIKAYIAPMWSYSIDWQHFIIIDCLPNTGDIFF